MARGAVDSNLPLASFTAYICIRYGNKENNNNNDHDDDNKMMVMMTDAKKTIQYMLGNNTFWNFNMSSVENHFYHICQAGLRMF